MTTMEFQLQATLEWAIPVSVYILHSAYRKTLLQLLPQTCRSQTRTFPKAKVPQRVAIKSVLGHSLNFDQSQVSLLIETASG